MPLIIDLERRGPLVFIFYSLLKQDDIFVLQGISSSFLLFLCSKVNNINNFILSFLFYFISLDEGECGRLKHLSRRESIDN